MAESDPSPPPTASAPLPPRTGSRRRTLGALLVLIGASLFGLLLFRLVGPRPVPPPKIVLYTPQQAEAAGRNLDALSAQLRAPSPDEPAPDREPTRQPADRRKANSTHAPAAGPIRLQISEADLNTYLATDPKVRALLASHGVQAVQLLLHAPHAVTCRAAVLYQGRKTNVQITGDLLPARSSVARFVTTKAQVGSLPLPPGIVTAQANRIAGRLLGRARGRFRFAVQNIQVVGDHLVLSGVRLPTQKK